jgi:hypothetical protein
MKKCSYCGRENPDEALNCHECGTEFEHDATNSEPVGDNELKAVNIRSYGIHESAQIAAAFLQSQGIHNWISVDDCGGMMPMIGGGGAKLFVYSKDVEEAENILSSQQQPKTPNNQKESVIKTEEIVHDRPKFIIVAGVGVIYGTGLILNIRLLILSLNGTFVGIRGFIYFWLSIGCGALCAYLLYRAVKNYQIQRRRMEKEKDGA